jgi:hypothetical protein
MLHFFSIRFCSASFDDDTRWKWICFTRSSFRPWCSRAESASCRRLRNQLRLTCSRGRLVGLLELERNLAGLDGSMKRELELERSLEGLDGSMKRELGLEHNLAGLERSTTVERERSTTVERERSTTVERERSTTVERERSTTV